MHDVLVAMGSNYIQSAHIQWASDSLSLYLDNMRFSQILWTQDIHGTGVWYMNRLAWGQTSLSVKELEQKLKQIEQDSRRTVEQVTIDLDILQYDQQRYHLRDWTHPYVLQLLDRGSENSLFLQ